MAADPTALRIRGLSVSAATAHGWFRVVDDVSLDLRPGTITGLAGESGSGKTVTALATMGLLDRRVLRIDQGEVLLDDTDLLALPARALRRVRGRDLSMVFQEPMTSLDPMWPVGKAIDEVLRTHLGLNRRAARSRTLDLLARVGIADPERRADLYPFEMSGGMQQRVLIAMAIACEPRVVIADEPTTALDVTVQAQIMALLRSLATDGMAVLLVTHDMGVMSQHSDDLAVMYAGQVVEHGPTAEVLADPQHPYTAGLLASVPTTEARLERLASIPGRVPLAQEMPTGCRFAPRCAHAVASCDQPQVVEVLADGRSVRCARSHELDLHLVAP